MRPFHDQDVRQVSAACCRVRTGGARSHEVPLAPFSREIKSTKDFSGTHQDLPIRIILTCSSLRESRRVVRPGSWMRWRGDGRDAFLSGLPAQVFSGITDEARAKVHLPGRLGYESYCTVLFHEPQDGKIQKRKEECRSSIRTSMQNW